MNFNYGQLSDKDTLLNFDYNFVTKAFFPLLEIQKLVPKDGQVVVSVLQGSEEKDGQQRVAFGVTASDCWQAFAVSWTNQRHQ